MSQFKILIVDDEENQRESLSGFLKKKGYETTTADSYESAVELVKSSSFDMLLTDFKLPGKSGLDLLKDTKRHNPTMPVVVMTAYGSIEDAVEIMKSGSFDYIQKPIELQELLHIIKNCQERIYLISENEMLKNQLKDKYSFDSIISHSSEMENVINTAGRVANSKASILIRGESGTGKELIARAIHFSSPRNNQPFVVVNCAAMPDTLFESELFGHEKGAFTGADKLRIGKFEQANKGTLFIDEVGDIPLPVQVKLLRAVQFGEIERLGGKSTIQVDTRIITATNRNLEEMIKNNEFREDLYYRFNVITINIPPLRSRKIEIPHLVDFFIKKYADINAKDVKSISKEAFDALMKYEFPGNVRELENIIQRAVVLTRETIITQNDLPSFIFELPENSISKQSIALGDLNQTIETIEKDMITRALDASSGNQSKAATILNISERTFRYKMSKYNLK